MAIARTGSLDLGNNNGTTNNLSASYTNTNGGSCLIVYVDTSASSQPTVTFGSISVPLFFQDLVNGGIYIYILLSAPAVTANISVSFGSTVTLRGVAISYDGVATPDAVDGVSTNSDGVSETSFTDNYSTTIDNCWGIGFGYYPAGRAATYFSGNFVDVIGQSHGNDAAGDTNGPINPAGSVTMTTTQLTAATGLIQYFFALVPSSPPTTIYHRALTITI